MKEKMIIYIILIPSNYKKNNDLKIIIKYGNLHHFDFPTFYFQ